MKSYRIRRCPCCGQRFDSEEGRVCDCFECEVCKEWFTGDQKANVMRDYDHKADVEICYDCFKDSGRECWHCGYKYLEDHFPGYWQKGMSCGLNSTLCTLCIECELEENELK